MENLQKTDTTWKFIPVLWVSKKKKILVYLAKISLQINLMIQLHSGIGFLEY